MSRPRQSAAGSTVTYLVAIFLLMIAIYFINVGVNLYTTGELANSLVYLGVGVVSLALVGITVMRVRRGYAMAGIHPKVLSMVRCAQCSFKQIKSFAIGDYVSKSEGRCSQCGNESLFINGIYAEDQRKHPNTLM